MKKDAQRVVELKVDELITQIHVCHAATVHATNEDVPTTVDQRKQYQKLFTLVTGRKPTTAELKRMLGVTKF